MATEFHQQTSRDSDDHEDTFLYGGPVCPRPRPRAYRPRSTTSDTIPFVDAEVSLPHSNGSIKDGSLDRRRVYNYLIPPPPPPPPPSTTIPLRNQITSTLETEDSTSLNNILDALDDLERSEGSDEDRRSSMATTGSMDDSEDELDVLTDLPVSVGKWSAVKSEVSMRVDDNSPSGPGDTRDHDGESRDEPSGYGAARSEHAAASPPPFQSQVGLSILYTA